MARVILDSTDLTATPLSWFNTREPGYQHLAGRAGLDSHRNRAIKCLALSFFQDILCTPLTELPSALGGTNEQPVAPGASLPPTELAASPPRCPGCRFWNQRRRTCISPPDRCLDCFWLKGLRCIAPPPLRCLGGFIPPAFPKVEVSPPHEWVVEHTTCTFFRERKRASPGKSPLRLPDKDGDSA